MANKRRLKKVTCLWSVTQGLNETLESYTKRFTTTYSCVTNPNENLAIQDYIAGVANENVQSLVVANYNRSRRTHCYSDGRFLSS